MKSTSHGNKTHGNLSRKKNNIFANKASIGKGNKINSSDDNNNYKNDEVDINDSDDDTHTNPLCLNTFTQTMASVITSTLNISPEQ